MDVSHTGWLPLCWSYCATVTRIILWCLRFWFIRYWAQKYMHLYRKTKDNQMCSGYSGFWQPLLQNVFRNLKPDMSVAVRRTRSCRNTTKVYILKNISLTVEVDATYRDVYFSGYFVPYERKGEISSQNKAWKHPVTSFHIIIHTLRLIARYRTDSAEVAYFWAAKN